VLFRSVKSDVNALQAFDRFANDKQIFGIATNKAAKMDEGEARRQIMELTELNKLNTPSV